MAREVPNVPTGLDPQTRNFFSAIREAVNQFTLNGGGSSADSLNSNLTVDNLTGISDSLDKLLATTIPPIPTGVTVTGVFSTIMVTWNNPNYAYYSFAEIWRANALDSSGLLIPATGSNANGHSINFATDAKLVGTSNGNIYTDSVTPGSKYYYWVRFLSMANIAGPYNASTGIIGATAQDIYALMQANGWTVDTDALLDGLITANKIEDFAVTNAKIANTAITNAKIANAAISTAQIQDLAVTSAKIASLGVEKLYAASAWIHTADILDGQITNAKIGNVISSDNYNGSTLGWQLSKSGGTVNLNQLTIRDAAGNIILSSGTGVPWSAIAAGGGKAADNATVGATFGSNIYGQITPANVSTYIANAAIKTAQIGDLAVDTLQIAGNAVTVPASAYSAAGQGLGGGNQEIQALYIVCAGGGIRIDYGYMSDGYQYSYVNQYCYWLRGGRLNLYRDGSLIKAGGLEFGSVASSFVDYPGAGGHTYSLQYNLVTWANASGTGSLSHRYINALEIKK